MAQTVSFNDAVRLHQSGRLTEAKALYRAFAEAFPRHEIGGRSLLNLGAVLLGEGQPAEAEVCLRCALEILPENADALGNLGLALRQQRQPEEAVSCFRRVLARSPDNVGALGNLGVTLTDIGRFDEAATCFQRRLALDPSDGSTLFNFGCTLDRAGRFEHATALLLQAHRVTPDDSSVRINLGNVLETLRRIDEAIGHYEAVIAREPDHAQAHWNLALALLARGDAERGWREYEWRWESTMASRRRRFTVPQWQGEPLDGRTILIHGEQGLGDTIQFARFLADVWDRRPARIVLEAQTPLAGLLGRSLAADGLTVVEQASDFPGGAGLPPFDAHLPITSLPLILGLLTETHTERVPYLSADPERRKRWARRLDAALPPGLPRVGLVWAGNPGFSFDRLRSPRLASLRPLLDTPGVSFVGLQLGDGRRDLIDQTLPPAFFDAGIEIGDFEDTAALMANLDLVISSCTAPAHLAGALGRPLWLVLSFAADWRWGLAGAETAWYPTARLFRQPRAGDWAAVAVDVASALSDFRDRFLSSSAPISASGNF